MRELNYEHEFECTIETVFEHVFYHSQFVNQMLTKRGDFDVNIMPWITDNNEQTRMELSQIYNNAIHKKSVAPMKRSVHFKTQNTAPTFISKTLGIPDVIQCEIKDNLEWIIDNREHREDALDSSVDAIGLAGFIISSQLFFTNVPMNSSLDVRITWNVRRVARYQTHCHMHIVCQFKTSMWGVTGLVETFMESDAKKSFGNWLQEAHKYIEQNVEQEEDAESSAEESYWGPSDEVSSVTSFGSHLTQGTTCSSPSAASSDSFHSIISSKSVNESMDTRTNGIAKRRAAVKKISFQEPASVLLNRSLELSELKQELREVRALVSKTELRVEQLQKEFSNHELDVINRMYLQRIDQLYKAQNEKIEMLRSMKDRESTSDDTTANMPVLSEREQKEPEPGRPKRVVHALFWFGLGALSSSIFSIFLYPILVKWLRHLLPNKFFSNRM
jgi:hypothetical protein